MMSGYKIKVPNFEGPLDLLLFFIRRDELDIYDIPIAHITREFLDYMHLMQMLDLELAGEFIVMAAMLMQIKVRMMLPGMETAEGEEGSDEDPRSELVRRLIEYKRYKEAASELRGLEEEQRGLFYRTYFTDVVRRREDDEGESLRDLTMFDLIASFRSAIRNFENRPVHEIVKVPYSIEDQAKYIINIFGERKEVHFGEVLKSMREKIEAIVTFIALLELIRARRICVRIHTDFNDFTIIRNEPEESGIRLP